MLLGASLGASAYKRFNLKGCISEIKDVSLAKFSWSREKNGMDSWVHGVISKQASVLMKRKNMSTKKAHIAAQRIVFSAWEISLPPSVTDEFLESITDLVKDDEAGEIAAEDKKNWQTDESGRQWRECAALEGRKDLMRKLSISFQQCRWPRNFIHRNGFRKDLLVSITLLALKEALLLRTRSMTTAICTQMW